jgi:hypothetical protein
MAQHYMLNIDAKNGKNELQYWYVRARIGISLSFSVWWGICRENITVGLF